MFLTIFLRYFQDNLSGPGVKELLYFSIVLISFSFEKIFYFIVSLPGISSSN